MSKQNIILIRGYPGSGKTTVGKMLESLNFGTFIDHNEMLTFITKKVGNDDGIYDEIYALEIAMTNKLLNEKCSVIVARGFSSVNSIKPYLDIADLTNSRAFIFKLNVAESNLAKRVISKERLKDFNPTISKKTLLERIASNPIENINGEYVIDANKKINEVINQIKVLVASRPSR